MNRPNTCANLIKAINSLYKDTDTVRLSRAMGNVIVAQMLPDGVVKGGSSLVFAKEDSKGLAIAVSRQSRSPSSNPPQTDG